MKEENEWAKTICLGDVPEKIMKKHKIFKYIGIILSSLLMVVSVLLAFSAKWMFDTWTSLTMDELVFHLTTSLEGTNTDMIKAYCLKMCRSGSNLFGCSGCYLGNLQSKKEKHKQNDDCYMFDGNCCDWNGSSCHMAQVKYR